MNNIEFKTFKNMLIQGSNNLKKFTPKINKLNVFPVPDGDTGSNMFQTVESGYQAILNIEKESFKNFMKIFSKATLMGACGNSGVILSQFFKGFAIGIKNGETIKIKNFINMFVEAKKYAYAAVKKATEGTILTLIRVLSEKLTNHHSGFENYNDFFKYVKTVNKTTIDNTPNLLQVLKDAKVVDSGAFGLGIFIEGMILGYQGKEVNIEQEKKLNDAVNIDFHAPKQKEFGYCSEFVILLEKNLINNINKAKIENDLSKIGTSTVVVNDEEILKVHIHTLHPGKLLNYAEKFGSFAKIKIENMTTQVHDNQHVTLDKHNIIIAVSSGIGITKKLKELGADFIINGGQSSNPTVKDFVNIIDQNQNAKNIIILPNNKNILLAAKQVWKQYLLKRRISIIETKTMWEGINCLMNFNIDWDHKTRVRNFRKTLQNSITFQITKAIKDYVEDGKKIKKDDFVAILNSQILFHHFNIKSLVLQVVKYFIKQNIEFVFISEGKNKISGFDVAKDFEKLDLECEIISGEQGVYHYIIGGE